MHFVHNKLDAPETATIAAIATDLNGNSGPQTIEEGAAEIVRVALLDPPVTGRFLEKEGEIPW